MATCFQLRLLAELLSIFFVIAADFPKFHSMKLSVVIPVFNEQGNIEALHHRLRQVMTRLGISYELIFVNDGSKDRSLELIKALAETFPEVKYIDFSRNFGHQIAVSAGLDAAAGEAAVIIDADLQDPPELIAELHAKLREGYEIVYARRISRQGETWFKKTTAKLFYRLLSKLTPVKIPLDTGDFRIIDRKVIDVLRAMPERHKFLRGQIAWMGFRQTAVEYHRAPRHAGDTGYSFAKMARFALDGITAFSDLPLKIVTYLGFAVLLFSFITAAFVLYARLAMDATVPGWTSLMITVLFLGSIQMIAIGIIGEYLSRMNANIRQRPLYIVRESNVNDAARAAIMEDEK
jgi:glycosyltransferase involved in cell wall biosynthesis